MDVEIFSKPDCPLCDDAKEVLLAVQRRIPFRLVETNIEDDPVLYERYKYDIPVVFIGGKKAFKHRVDEKALEARLRR
jgi:glutaredoxin